MERNCFLQLKLKLEDMKNRYRKYASILIVAEE